MSNIDSKHVLCIQDTTWFNFDHLSNKIGKDDPEIGPTSKKKVAGLFSHPMLVCDSKTDTIFGLADNILYNREWNHNDKKVRKYKSLPIEEKESYRWIESTNNSRGRISEDVKITVIADRESDIFEEFVLADSNTAMLIRSRTDRNTTEGSGKLYSILNEQPLSKCISLELAGNISRKKRTAKVEVRFCSATIKAPEKYKGEKKSIPMYAIEAKEVNANLPKGEKPVLWRLLTTHKVEDITMALQCINWYKKRWLIEELFRVIKTKGFRIESSQLGNGAAIKKLIALTFEAGLQVMRLKLALVNQEKAKVESIFKPNQVKLLLFLTASLEGKTSKQKNPYPKKTTAWAAWIIARLGNWTGYKSHGAPGYITMKNGLNTFYTQYEIYELWSSSA